MKKSSETENFLAALIPGGIQAQERRGQEDIVIEEVLPRECEQANSKPLLERMGIIVGEPADDLFYNVTLPDGWEKVAEDHAMWSRLEDDKGRIRAHSFYKAAFYDRKAHINIARRFNADWKPIGGWETETKETPLECFVTDSAAVIWKSEPMPPNTGYYDLRKPAEDWLNEHHPDWRNPFAYWD